MNAVVPTSFGQVSKVFASQPVENELGAGIQGGFGLIGYKGKVWSIRKGGEDHPLMREDGDGPRNSIEIVIVKAPGVVSKIFYQNGYEEGSKAPPDCYSTNGVTPAAGAASRQFATCAGCPQNAWGSRVTPAGKQGKACSDSKRLAVVPLGDLRNEAYGGPMLLRVPAASLSELRNFGDKMAALGFPSGSYGVRIAFDVDESYPKFIFSAIRPLNDVEAAIVMELRNSPETARVLAEDEYSAPAQALPAPSASPFEQPMQLAAPAGGVQSQGTTLQQQTLQAQLAPGNVVPLQPRLHTTGEVSSPAAPTAAHTGPTPHPQSSPTAAPASAPAQPSGGASTAPSLALGAQHTVISPAEHATVGAAGFDALLDNLLK